MKKKNLLLFLLFPLTSCSFNSNKLFSWDAYKNNNAAMSLESPKYKNFKFSDLTDEELNKIKSKLETVVVEKGNVNSFIKAMYEFSGAVNKVANSYIMAETKYYSDSDASYEKKSQQYFAQYNDLFKFVTALEEKIYHSSKEIKELYFEGMTDEEIEEIIEGNEAEIIAADYDEIFIDYQNEGEELYNEYIRTRDSKTYIHSGYEYFLRYINKANELVKKLDRENYLDFSYERDYGRDYKVEDALNFVKFVKQYLVPIYLDKPELEIPSNCDSNLVDDFNTLNFCNSNLQTADWFKNYAVEIGGEYLKRYNHLFNNGYYCFSDSPKSLTTAFNWNLSGTNDAVLFFSRNYQNILTVVHEFGHYYATTSNFGARLNDTMDLNETYSQANEFTFLTYVLDQTKEDEKADTYEYIGDYKAYDTIFYFIQEAVITEIENFAYTTPDLDIDSLRSGIESILMSYNGTASDTYYIGPCITSPCYYISYATSNIEALQFYSMPFEKAKETYTKLVEDPGEFTMVERWTNAGLTSPFEEDTFKTIANMLSNIANKY